MPQVVYPQPVQTADLLDHLGPSGLTTSDAHPSSWGGELEDFTDPDGYAGSWEQVALKGKTCPAVGNHEYADPPRGPAGYLAYCSPPCPHRPDLEYARTREGAAVIPTAYAYRAAPGSGWWAYVLDSQCAHAKVHWLYAVAAYAGRASLIVNGHSHAYERFTSMTASGTVDGSFTAPRSVTVGTGGAPLIRFSKAARAGTRYRDAAHHGVLRITLGKGHWTSEFDRVDGVVADKASAGC